MVMLMVFSFVNLKFYFENFHCGRFEPGTLVALMRTSSHWASGARSRCKIGRHEGHIDGETLAYYSCNQHTIPTSHPSLLFSGSRGPVPPLITRNYDEKPSITTTYDESNPNATFPPAPHC